MHIHFSVKQMAKKRPFIKQQHIDIPGEYGQPYSLQHILATIVQHQVAAFNQRKEEKSLIGFLQESELQAQADTGKVGFGTSYNNQQADVDKAIAAVLQAVEDGIIVVFLDEEECQLDSQIILSEDSLFTFIRLTFLTGSFW